MKIRRLDLIAYGPFTDLSLDLSAGSEGLHLFFGPNEAGKSSALRAIHDLFYGIETRTKDNFLHDYNQLKLGAEIGDRRGNRLDFHRRKGNKNTIRAAADDSTIEPEVLDRFLGGVDSETFRSLFGIDHGRLVEGGRAILEGKGQVGQLLFAAGSGLTGLRSATSGIQDELERMFKPRGQNPDINRLLGELGGLRKRVQERQLPGEEWTRHDEALRDSRRRKEEVDLLRSDRSKERSRLIRIREALNPIAEREEIRAQLDAISHVVPLPADFGERHREARESLTRALALAEQAEADRLDAEQRLEAVEPPDVFLAKAEAIESLHQRLGEYLKGQADRPGLLRMQQSDEHMGRSILVELGKPRDLDEAEPLRLRGDIPERIRELGREKASLDANLDRHRQAVDTLADRLQELNETLNTIGPEPDLGPLRRAVDRCRKLGDPETALATGKRSQEAARRDLALELGRMPHWTGSIDALSGLAVPLDETIAEAVRSREEADRRLLQIEHDLHSTGEELETVEANIRAFQLKGKVPTEDDLDAARLRRDEGWRLIRLGGLDQSSDHEEICRFIAEFASGASLADAFEQSMTVADDQADRLRRETKRVASLSEHLAQRERYARRLDELERSHEVESEQIRVLRSDWSDRLRAQGFPDLDPGELRDWLRHRARLVEEDKALERRERELEDLSRAIADHREAIDRPLREVLGADVPEADSLQDRVERAAALIAEHDRGKVRRDELSKAIERARRERDDAVRQCRETERLLSEWGASWAPLMARLGLEADATPTQADTFLDRIDQLIKHLDSIKVFRARIAGIDRDAKRFADDVATLCRDVAPDLVDRPPGDAVAELYLRLGQARDLRKERDALIGNRAEAERKVRSATETIARDQARLVALCQEARCNSPDELPAAEAAAADRARLESELRRIEDQIRNSSAGLPLDAFIAEARDVDADGLDFQIRELEEQLEAIERDRSELDQAIGGEGEWLRSQQGGDDAADAAERTQSLLAELRSKVEDYAALRIAVELLHRGIEQFREENQGPVVRRAGELFATLTAGSFRGLKLDEDDQGQPILHGLREDGRPLGVDAMSDGSCDQLYLALRLASLEGWLARHEPIPLIADDILLNFDDERSAEALRALAELSSKTQVLFFTHHEHLVELARSILPDDVLFVHRLDRAVGISSTVS